MAEENKNIFNLNESFYENMKKAVNVADSFEKQIESVKKAINDISEMEIKLKNEEALKKIVKTNKTLNEIKKNVAIIIGAKDTASESLKNIKKNINSIASKPVDIVIKARDKTKDTIDKVKNNLLSAKEKLSKVFINDYTKAAVGVTFGEAIKSEKNMSMLKTNLKDEKSASEAMAWANQISRQTHLTSNESVESVINLTEKGLDYKKFFMTAGNLSAAKNKSMDEVIAAMGNLSSGNVNEGISSMKSFGVTKEMWEKQGIKFDDGGNVLNSSKEATEAITKIVDENWKNAMANKSKNVDGQIKNIKDSVFSMGKNIIGVKNDGTVEEGGVFYVFKQQLERILVLLDKFKESDAFKGIKKSLADIVSNYGNKFANFLENVMKNPDEYKKRFDDFKSSIVSAVKDAKDLGSAAKDIVEILKPVLLFIKDHPTLSLGVLFGGKALKGGISGYKEIKEISKDMTNLKNSFKGFGAGGKGVGKGIGGTIKSIFGEGKLQFKLFKDMMKKDSKSSLSNISKFFSSVSGTTKLWSGVIGNVLKNNFTKAFKTLNSTLKGFSIIKPLQEAAKSFKSLGVMKEMPKALSAAFKPLKTVFSTLGKVVNTVFTGMGKVIGRFFAFMAANPLVAIILIIVAAVILVYEAWTQNWFGIQEKTKKVIDFVKEKIKSVEEVFAPVKESIGRFVEYVLSSWDTISFAFSHPKEAIINFVQTGTVKGKKKEGNNALGTSYWDGGWTWVENCPVAEKSAA